MDVIKRLNVEHQGGTILDVAQKPAFLTLTPVWPERIVSLAAG